jgi:hypothetical protein
MLNKKTAMYTDEDAKKLLKEYCKETGIPMSEFLRCILKLSMIQICVDMANKDMLSNLEEANYIRERLKRGKI